MKDWVLWMTTIFMPLNDIREKIIIEKAYLIVEEQMPQCLLDFVTHVVGYKAVLAQMGRGRLHRTPLHHRLASRVRRLCKALLCLTESRTNRAAAQCAMAHLSAALWRKRVIVSA